MSSDTAETVKRARELMDSGIDPLVLMSQLASLIMDIIAGTYRMNGSNHNDPLFGGRTCKYIYSSHEIIKIRINKQLEMKGSGCLFSVDDGLMELVYLCPRVVYYYKFYLNSHGANDT